MPIPRNRVLGALAMSMGMALAAPALLVAPALAADQPDLGVRTKAIISIDALQFRDLNANGSLDPYEDWRLPVADRVDDLVARMTLEEKAGLMLIDTLNAGCQGSLLDSATDYVNNQQMHRFIFRNTVTGTPTCGPDSGFRAGSSVTPGEAARFMNSMQELGESTRLGIPVLYKSNARNHIDPDARAGINESAGAMTAFPKEAGIAAAALGEAALTGGDGMSVVEDFATVMGEEWSSYGLRGMYGYMADLSTEPRWYRDHETFTENAELNADIMTTLVGTLQGPVDADGVSLSPTSDVALTMKHFPGGGPQELGLDPHYSFGKTQVYPEYNGDNYFGYHLKPFEAAIDAGVSAIMPYYGAPVALTYNGTTYQQTGMAFSDQIVNGLLRDELGFQGYVNSDTGIINDRAWGLETSTVPERVAAAINAGTDTLSGFHDVTTITQLVDDGLLTADRIDLAARRLLTPMFQMGLFENPYVDETAADATVGSEANRAVGLDVQRKSAVLLQNNDTTDPDDCDKVLPLKAGATIYLLGDFNVETIRAYGNAGFTVIDGNQEQRPSAAGADYLLVSMTAKTANTRAYGSQDPATGANPEHISPIVLDGVVGLDGQSTYGAADACNAYGAAACTDNGLIFGGSYPWESSVLDFSGMDSSESWQVVPALSTIQAAMAEIGDPNKVVLNVYFRQPFVLDEASGLLDTGAIVATFGISDTALMDVLTGAFAPQGRMPFALAASREAIENNLSNVPGYPETPGGELFGYGFGLTYQTPVCPVDETPVEKPTVPTKLPATGFRLMPIALTEADVVGD